ncbi:MAG: proline--tRNA ligase [Puniceicoccales bacterium]|jgi:prolyl-tRNA synthetase|nr:proline--tRNA ligase [Puniceicoccales bacterium]
MEKKKHGISPLRSENFPEWYQQVIKGGDLAENSDVRGCMVIKPWGYALWENMQRVLDGMFKETGHSNAYFPLFIPLRYLEKEAEHVEAFAKECAVVTHARLQADGRGKLVPASPLEEPLIVRPTSETIIGESFSRWVHSYRDLPILINQWANVVRWEMRTRLFLRTSEFLWQEGHTVHETSAEAEAETERMLECYRAFAEDYMAMPVLCGEKTEMERFPGAVRTLCIEAMMQDGKSLQAGTSHFLGQNFARASRIQFVGRSGETQCAWTSSWGVSTRLIGGLIMVHSDDDGLILPPRLAPRHVVILPIIHRESDRERVLDYCQKIEAAIRSAGYDGRPVEVHIDGRDFNGGVKKWEWIGKGVPLIVELGPRDVEQQSVAVLRRYTMEKYSASADVFLRNLGDELAQIQRGMFERARLFREKNMKEIISKQEFEEFFMEKSGYGVTFFVGDRGIEEAMKEKFNVTIRCILPHKNGENQSGICAFTGQQTTQKVVWAKSY